MAIINGDANGNFLSGTAGDDEINGLGGDDLIFANGGNDVIDGGEGFDTYETGVIEGFTFDLNGLTGTGTGASSGDVQTLTDLEQFVSRGGPSVFNVGPGFTNSLGGFVKLVGGASDDVFNVADPNLLAFVDMFDATDSLLINLTTGIARGQFSIAAGGIGNDTLNGVTHIIGSAFADEITGSVFDDVLDGQGGNDLFFATVGNDTYNGGVSGDDTVQYFGHPTPAGVNVNLSAGITTFQDGSGDVHTLQSIEFIIGTQFDDQIIGNGAANVFTGGDGNDFLSGGAGFDSLLGSAGDDVLQGGDGDDVLDGGFGFDTVSLQDRLVGFTVNLNANSTVVALDNSETDTLFSIDSVVGTNFADTFIVGADFIGEDRSGFVNIRGGSGNDTITGNGEVRIDFRDALSGVRVDFNLGQGAGIQNTAGIGTDTFTGVAQVRGSEFDDILLGSDGAGFESFRGQAGNDFIDGRGGSSDRADYRSSPAAVVVDLAARTAQDGFGTLDFLFNIEDVRGSSFNDTLLGDDNINVFRGRGGNDFMNGRGGFVDTADYRVDATAGITVSMSSISTVTGNASVGLDTLVEVERVFGSRFNDTYLADSTFDNGGGINDQPGKGLFNVFRGGDGNDTITGNGVTRIEYTNATDGVRVDLGTGEGRALNVEIGAEVGFDTITAQSVFEIRGSSFNDILLGSNLNPLTGFESFIGDAGNDTFDGRLGRDRANYSTAETGVVVNLASGQATNDGFGGFDTLISIEDVKGSNFDDVLIGSTQNNVFESLKGDDEIRGGFGQDTAIYHNLDAGVFVDLRSFFVNKGANGKDDLLSIEDIEGTSFNDIVIGSAGDNVLFGLGGNDRLVGIAGDDDLEGGDGNDVLFGNSGDDVLVGGAGRDRLIGGFGIDTMFGGAGNDTYYVDNADDVVFEDFGEGIDTVIIQVSPGNFFQAVANVEIYILDTTFGASLIGRNGFNDTLIGSGFNDTLQGLGGDDLLQGSNGDDLLFGGLGNDKLKGGSGVDQLVGNDGDDVLIGGLGDDVFVLDNNLTGLALVEGGVGSDTPFEQNNVLAAGLKGGAGFDRLNGQAGDDILEGGAGTDRLIGGAGDDILIGGVEDGFSNGVSDGASDRFLFSSNSGNDTILDFEDGIDQIDFRGVNLETGRFPVFSAVQAAISEVNGNAVITITANDTITLVGVSAADLDASDFILGEIVIAV